MRERSNEELFQLNDYELLYLIQEGSEEAFQLMFEKYQPLILSKVTKFFTDRSMYDDYIQEGRIALFDAINKYQPDRGKTFTRYFEMILDNRFISILRSKDAKKNKIVLMEELFPEYQVETKCEYEIPLEQLSDFEEKVYRLKYERRLKAEIIAQELDCTIKQIYNATERIKRKFKEYNLNDKEK